jgi:hypothetical protein
MPPTSTPPSRRAWRRRKSRKPPTKNGHAPCSGIWAEFAELDLGTDFVALLDPALSEASARTATSHWEKQATLAMGLGMGELDVETELYIEMQTESAWDLAEGVVWGDDYNYLFILGQCAVPAAE